VGARIGIDLTLLLVAVSFKQVLASEVPPIAYLTLLDAYTIGVLSFLVLSLALHAVMGFALFDCDNPTGACPAVGRRAAQNLLLYAFGLIWRRNIYFD
jgi:hypothetical protein